MKKNIKYTLLILLLFSGQLLLSQDKMNKSRRISLGLIIAPQFSNWSYNTTAEYQEFVDVMDSIYNTKNGGSIGFIMEFHFDKKSSLKTGLTTSFYPFETIVLNVNGDDPTIPCGQISFSGIDYFIDIPLIYKYSLYSTKRVNLFLGAGIINKFLFCTRTKSFSICNGEKELTNKSLTLANDVHFFMAASIEAGVEISITERFNIGFFPSFEYSLINIQQDRQITKKYYQLGLNLIMAWKI